MSNPFKSKLLTRRKQASAQPEAIPRIELPANASPGWYLELMEECMSIMRERFREGR